MTLNAKMAEPVEKSDQTVYHGNCHCGRYRFQVTAPEIKDAISCNCILCRKKGYLWLVPEDGSFKALRDDGSLQEYKSAALADKVRFSQISVIIASAWRGLTTCSFVITAALASLESILQAR